MGVISVKKNRYQPVRYEIYLDTVLVFSVSASTLSPYISITELKKLRKGASLHLALPLEKLAQDEKTSLMELAYFYLSKAERSPYHLQMWLKKRNVPETWAVEIIKSCREKQFLNPERFATAFTAKRKAQGNKPWHRVRYELKCHELEETLIDKHIYNDLEILKTAYLETSWGKKLPIFAKNMTQKPEELSATFEKLKTTLQKQGFSYSIIDQFVHYLKAILDTVPEE